jgi:hypothetical protein
MPDADLIERELREQYPRPSAAATERARAAVMETATEPSRPARAAKARGQWRPVLVGAAIALALGLVGVGLAAGFGAFEGTPAPPDVSTNFKELNQFADAAVQKGFALKLPQTDASKAHGVVEIQTPDGPEDLWAAPNNQGGQCYLINWANDPIGKNGSRYGVNGCEQSPPPPSHISFGDVWVYAHPDVMTVYGSVYVPAATVQITLDDDSTATLPVVENLFIGSLTKGAKVEKVTAFDAAGNQVAEWTKQ